MDTHSQCTVSGANALLFGPHRGFGTSYVFWPALILLIGVISLTAGGERSADRQFHVSPDSTEPFFQLDVRGGYSLGSLKYTVWPDGRVVKTTNSEEKTTSLEPSKVQSIASLVANGGLMDWDGDALWARIVEAVGDEPVLTDQPVRRVRITLTEYNGHAQVETDFSYSYSPSYVRHLAPEADLPEIDSLIAITKALQEAFQPGGGA